MSSEPAPERLALTHARALVQEADRLRDELVIGWNELGSSNPWDMRVVLGAESLSWSIEVACLWPAELAQRLDGIASRFAQTAKAALDAAVLGTAEFMCASIGPPPPESHDFPLTDSKSTLTQLVEDGLLMGLRPDQVRLLENFQPWTDGSAFLRETGLHMAHLAALLRPRAAGHRMLAVWAATPSPMAYAGEVQLNDIQVQPDGALDPTHTVATFVVPPELASQPVSANPNVGFDLIFNASPPPRGHDDNLERRSRRILDCAEMFITALEASMNQPAVWNAAGLNETLPPTPDPPWVPVEFDDADEHHRVAADIAQSPYRLASYRGGGGDLVLLRLESDFHVASHSPVGAPAGHELEGTEHAPAVVGRRIRQASLIDPDQPLGTATENAALHAARSWGLPDFVFPPEARVKGSGVRELGDGTIWSGLKGLALQVKARDAQPTDPDKERRWLAKKSKQAARQGAGTIRTYLNQPALEMTNMRGRQVKIDGTQVAWIVVVILDHPDPPQDVSTEVNSKIETVVVLRREWDFLWDQLRSVSAVVEYFHRVAAHQDDGPRTLGEEIFRYLELAHADHDAEPDIPAWMADIFITPNSSPVLPLEPASAADTLGHSVFRQILDDIAATVAYSGPEAKRLDALARLDRYGVGDRANLGRNLVAWFDECLLTPPTHTRFQHRTMLIEHGHLHLAFSVGSGLTGFHAEIHRSWLMLRRHQLLAHLAASDPDAPPVDQIWTLGVLLTPRPDGGRLWDTTIAATNSEPDFEPEVLAVLTEHFGELGTEGNLS